MVGLRWCSGHRRTLSEMAGVTVDDRCLAAKSLSTGLYEAL